MPQKKFFRKKRSFFSKLLMFFTAFFLIIEAFSLHTYFELNRSFEGALVAINANLAHNISGSINKLMSEIFQANYLISLDDTIQSAYSSYVSFDDTCYYLFPHIIRTLSSVTAFSDYIDNVAIYKRNNGLVISDKSVYSEQKFFNVFHSYADYDLNFWNNTESSSTYFKILSPTRVSTYHADIDHVLLPVICSGAFGTSSTNLLIFDLNYDAIIKMLDAYRSTPNSIIYILDANSGKQLFASGNSTALDTELLSQQLCNSNGESFRIDTPNENYLVMQQMQSINFQSIEIVSCIPQTDITQILKASSRPLLTLSSVLTIVIALLLIFTLSKRASLPVRKLMKQIAPNSDVEESPDEFELLYKIYSLAQKSLLETAKELEGTRDVAQDQLLRKFLLSESLTETEHLLFLDIFPLTAPHSFQLVLLHPIVKQSIYKDFSNDFCSNILNIIQSIALEFFPRENTHWVKIEKTYLCLLISKMSAQDDRSIERCCEKLLSAFSADIEYLSLFMFLDDRRIATDTLPKAYLNGYNQLKSVSPFSPSCLLHCSLTQSSESISFTDDLEDKLRNLVSSGKKQLMHDELEYILLQCQRQQLSVFALNQLMMQLYFIALKALRQNNLMLDSSLSEEFLNFCSHLSESSSEDIHTFILYFFDGIVALCDEPDYRLNSQFFKTFINEHYTQELSLDMLAQKYNTSAQYISRLIKKEVGMTYQSYINKLRIEKAQELLLQTNLSVADIYLAVGYNGRNTFIRTFKIICGITPSEYRKMYAKQQESPQL